MTAQVKGMDPHLGWTLTKADCNQAWIDRFIQRAADCRREISLGDALQRHFPGNGVLIDAVELASIYHISAYD